MNDHDCVALLQWALPRLQLRWPGLRKVRRQVCRRLARRLGELDQQSIAAYRDYLTHNSEEWAVLDGFCRISISRFYRDHAVFEALETIVLPTLARRTLDRGECFLRIWSAGCASGEEPYTLALVWVFGLEPRFPDLNVRILATDADDALLGRARRAIYPASSLKDLPREWRQRAFQRVGNEHELLSPFRTAVELVPGDIRYSIPTGPFDLVLCRNLVFTYFDAALQRELLQRIVSRILPGGMLVLGAHERLPAMAGALMPWRIGLPLFERPL